MRAQQCYGQAANERAAGRTPAATKECRRCKACKPAEEFYASKMTADGLQSYCKACYALAAQQRRARIAAEGGAPERAEHEHAGVERHMHEQARPCALRMTQALCVWCCGCATPPARCRRVQRCGRARREHAGIARMSRRTPKPSREARRELRCLLKRTEHEAQAVNVTSAARCSAGTSAMLAAAAVHRGLCSRSAASQEKLTAFKPVRRMESVTCAGSAPRPGSGDGARRHRAGTAAAGHNAAAPPGAGVAAGEMECM